jgi:folylpolyglutamate synthase/dihydropteroate synthase
VEHLPADDYTIMASILADKDVEGMLGGLASLGRRFVACRSANDRALEAEALARRARSFFPVVAAEPNPHEALALAHALGEPVLVTGSLYLLADLEAPA